MAPDMVPPARGSRALTAVFSTTPCWAESAELVPQFARALDNVLDVVCAAGGEPAHVATLRIYVTDKRLYLGQIKEIGGHYRQILGRHYPAMALIQISALVEEGALVEIEALAAVEPQ